MRLVAFADLHLDAPFAWAPPAFARRRRQGLRDTLQRIGALAVDARADAIVCGGDLFEHERISPDTEAFLRTAFADLHPIPVYIAPGNHDWYGPSSAYRRVAWSPNVHVFTAAHLEPVTLADGLTLWGAAHRAPANTDGFLDLFRVDRGGVHLALFHGSERQWLSAQGGTKVPHAPFDAEQIRRAGVHHAFVGHYHRRRDAERHTYPGNPDVLAFGEDGQSGVVVATVASSGEVCRERRTVAALAVHDVAVDITGCGSVQDVRACIASRLRDCSGAARVTLSGDLQPNVDLRLADLADAAEWMELVVPRLGPLHSGYDLEALAAEPTVRGEFVREVLAADAMPEETRRRVLVTGLRALDGRDDLEVP